MATNPRQYTNSALLIEAMGSHIYALLNRNDGDAIEDDPRLIAAIAWACSIIDDHLRARYAVPLATTNESIRGCCEGLVRWKLAMNRPEIYTDADADARKDAMKFLEDVAAAKIALELPIPNAQSSAGLTEIRSVILGSEVTGRALTSALEAF